jgi:hypothetical protein
VEAKHRIDDKVSATIKNLIDKYGDRPDRNVDILKSSHLKSVRNGRVSHHVACVIKEKIPRSRSGAQLLALLHGEVPLTKKEAVDAIDEDSRKDV